MIIAGYRIARHALFLRTISIMNTPSLKKSVTQENKNVGESRAARTNAVTIPKMALPDDVQKVVDVMRADAASEKRTVFSTSFIQRRCGYGYAHAVRVMDTLWDSGLIRQISTEKFEYIGELSLEPTAPITEGASDSPQIRVPERNESSNAKLEDIANEAVERLRPAGDGERVTLFNVILSALAKVAPAAPERNTGLEKTTLQDALIRAREDLRQHAVAFHINVAEGNYFRCRVCNAESKESDTHILHSAGCSFIAINIALKALEAPSDPERLAAESESAGPKDSGEQGAARANTVLAPQMALLDAINATVGNVFELIGTIQALTLNEGPRVKESALRTTGRAFENARMLEDMADELTEKLHQSENAPEPSSAQGVSAEGETGAPVAEEEENHG